VKPAISPIGRRSLGVATFMIPGILYLALGYFYSVHMGVWFYKIADHISLHGSRYYHMKEVFVHGSFMGALDVFCEHLFKTSKAPYQCIALSHRVVWRFYSASLGTAIRLQFWQYVCSSWHPMMRAHDCTCPLWLFRMYCIIILKITLACMYVSSGYAYACVVLPPQLELGVAWVSICVWPLGDSFVCAGPPI
jgi:hypothetical protein